MSDHAPDHDVVHEERLIYAFVAVTSSPIVIGALLAHSVIDAGPTLAFGGFCLAIAGLLRFRRRDRLPRAIVHGDRS